MKAAPVLSVNQSFQILLKLYNDFSFEEAFWEIIPAWKIHYFYSDKIN